MCQKGYSFALQRLLFAVVSVVHDASVHEFGNGLTDERQRQVCLRLRTEFSTRVDKARNDIAEGKGHRFSNVEELDKYIRSL